MSKRHSKFKQTPAPQREVRTLSEEVIVARVIQTIKADRFEGPLPPPDMLKRYDELCPGAANRIIRMAEEQGEHRRNIEKVAILSDSQRSNQGSIFAFILGLVIVVGSFVLIYLDKDISGIISLMSGLAALTGVFVYGATKRKKERLEKYGKNVDS